MRYVSFRAFVCDCPIYNGFVFHRAVKQFRVSSYCFFFHVYLFFFFHVSKFSISWWVENQSQNMVRIRKLRYNIPKPLLDERLNDCGFCTAPEQKFLSIEFCRAIRHDLWLIESLYYQQVLVLLVSPDFWTLVLKVGSHFSHYLSFLFRVSPSCCCKKPFVFYSICDKLSEVYIFFSYFTSFYQIFSLLENFVCDPIPINRFSHDFFV